MDSTPPSSSSARPPYTPQAPSAPWPPSAPQPSAPFPNYAPPGYMPPGYMPPGYVPPTFAPVRPPRRRRGGLFWLVLSLFLTPVVACGALIGATAIAQPQLLARDFSVFSTRVSGAVYGEDAAQREAGREVMSSVSGATVTCGDTHAMTDAHGQYTLSLLRGRDYTCSLTAPQYATTTVSIHPRLNSAYTLDFGSLVAKTAGAACVPLASGLRCGALALQPGSISGVAVDSATHQPINSASVDCWDNSLTARTGQNNPAHYRAVAGAQGQYIVAKAPAGPYVCVAAQSGTPQPVVVRPGAAATLDFSVCQRHCRGVIYHHGDVMHTFTAYVIFWTPSGARLNPNGSDARFRSLVTQYLQDVGGTRFYGLLTQYWDIAGPVRNVARLGGTFVDTHPYPHAGTRSDPLSDKDIYAEIERVSESQRWPLAPGVGFTLITAHGVETCTTYLGHRSCSFPLSNDTGFCAYHSSTSYYRPGATASYMPYMLITDVPGCDFLPTFGEGPAPYGAPLADAIINSLSHEQFEMVTDPGGQGWYGSDNESEIADKCETSFGSPAPDGSTVRLANGRGYVLQREWSNATNSCSYG